MDNFEEKSDMLVVAAASSVVLGVTACTKYILDSSMGPYINKVAERNDYMNSILSNESKCKSNLRMMQGPFHRLCGLLREKGLLNDTRNCSVEEKVMHFLHIIAHNVRFWVAEARYFRSLETVSRQFNETLSAVVKLYKYLVENHKDFIHNGGNQPQVTVDSRFTPYFKDCLDALDGTHITANVPEEEQIKFRSGKKGRTTQNVLAACSFDLKFTYVLAGWEGTAHDQRVLDDARSRMNPFIIPNGKYYLGDAGYTKKPGIFAPYRNTRYHLNEHIGRRPQTHKELFNKRHASLRNTIERAFRILKKCFPLLSTNSWFPYKIQVRITLACFVLHNFIMEVDPNDPITMEASNDDQAQAQDTIPIPTASSS